MPLKTVAFVGDAQAAAVADLYRDLIGARRGELVLHYFCDGVVPQEFARSLDVFDLICVQDRGSANAPLRESGLAADKLRYFPLLWSGASWLFHDWRGAEDAPSDPSIRLHRDRFLESHLADGVCGVSCNRDPLAG